MTTTNFATYIYTGKADPSVDHYDVTIKGNGTVRNLQLRPSEGPYNTMNFGLDPCTHHMVTVGARNKDGEGGTVTKYVPNHFPGGIRAASVFRTGASTATFSWEHPLSRGTSYPQQDNKPTQIFYDTKLVRMWDNAVIQTKSIYGVRNFNRTLFPVKYLDPKSSYRLEVVSRSWFGSCKNTVGRILLKKV